MDLVSNFDLDGIHYDYIRFTAGNQGYNPTSIARYNTRYGLTGSRRLPIRNSSSGGAIKSARWCARSMRASKKPNPGSNSPAPSSLGIPRRLPLHPGGFFKHRPYYDVYCDWDSWMEEE